MRTKRTCLPALALAATTAIAGCDPTGVAQPAASPSAAAVSPSAEPAAVPLTLRITPQRGAKNLPVSTEIGLAIEGGQIATVTLTRKGSPATVKGSVRDDGTSWVPASPLAFSSTYTAAVVARSPDGARSLTRTTTFTTMSHPGRQTGTGLYLFDGQTVGVAMPVVVEFSPPVPISARAGVQRRLFVTTDPPQPGVWHWASGSQVWYRPPDYWRPGTTITVRAGLRGHPMGNGYHGDVDRSATVRVGPEVLMEVDNTTKRMSVYEDGRLARTIPVSLGKPSTPSSSGHLVVMSKHYETVFDTRGEDPDGGYRIDINYAMRVTWGGEFIHAAPWSVGDQGRRNVSHGCINMATNHARWLFETAHIGDPVIVRGTEVKIAHGNGWTAWNLTWGEYIKGSALPVPDELARGGGAQQPPAAPNATQSPRASQSTSPADRTPHPAPSRVG
jgi:lipoprotein-anchoring transpeptidase ErfK/SrfK